MKIRELNVVQWLEHLNDKILEVLAALEGSLSYRPRGDTIGAQRITNTIPGRSLL